MAREIESAVEKEQGNDEETTVLENTEDTTKPTEVGKNDEKTTDD